MRRLTNQQCISKLQKIYGNNLDYSKVNYINSRFYITLICPIHGEFQQKANMALRGKGGCPKCKRKFTFNDGNTFIQTAQNIHGHKFDYSKVNYIDRNSPVIIICPVHGEFLQSPIRHLQSKFGCKQCYIDSKKTKPQKLSLEEKAEIRKNEWIEKCRDIHKNKYDYSLVKPIYNLSSKVPIICPVHGVFYQNADSHMKHGCNKCARLLVGNKLKLSFEDFKERAIKIHGNKYIYNNYKSMHAKIKIICPEHGEFTMTPSNHLKGYGCPTCASSKGELFINQLLTQLGVSFTKQFSIRLDTKVKVTNLVVIDFKIEHDNNIIFIEYNGIQHYKYIPYFHNHDISYFNAQLKRDLLLKDYCSKHNIKLVEIPYTMSINDIEQTIKNILYEN